MYRACIIVMSDKQYTGEEEDLTSDKIIEYLKKENFDIVVHNIIPEVNEIVKRALVKCCDEYEADLVVLIGTKKLADEARYEVEDKEDKKEFAKINYWIDGEKGYISSRSNTAVIQLPKVFNEINLNIDKIIETIKVLNA